jgi:hypothetical protein
MADVQHRIQIIIETVLKKTGLDRATGAINNWSRQAEIARTRSKRFHMELLSVMFAGMALERTMSNLLQPSQDLVGNFDILNTTLAVTFLPTALDVQDTLLTISDTLMNLPEGTQRTIGTFVLVGEGAGTAAAFVGQLGLAVFGLGQFMENVPMWASKIRDFANIQVAFSGASVFALEQEAMSLPMMMRSKMTIGNIIKAGAAGALMLPVAISMLFDEETSKTPIQKMVDTFSLASGAMLLSSAAGFAVSSAAFWVLPIAVVALMGTQELSTWSNAGQKAWDEFHRAYLRAGLGGQGVELGTVTGLTSGGIGGNISVNLSNAINTLPTGSGQFNFNNTFNVSGSLTRDPDMEAYLDNKLKQSNDNMMEELRNMYRKS